MIIIRPEFPEFPPKGPWEDILDGILDIFK